MTRAKKGASKASRITTKLFIKPKSVKALPAPEPPKFETLPVDAAQCRKAVHALVAHAKQKVAGNQKSDLLASDDDEMLWLAVTVKRMCVYVYTCCVCAAAVADLRRALECEGRRKIPTNLSALLSQTL